MRPIGTQLPRSLCLVAIASAAPTIAPDPNNITGTAGLILIDKLGHHKELSSLDAEVNPHVAISRDHRIAFAPDGRTVLVANHGDGTVSVLDLKERRLTANFPAGTGIESGTYY